MTVFSVRPAAPDLRGVPTLPTILLDRAVAPTKNQRYCCSRPAGCRFESDEALRLQWEALAAHPVTQEAWQIASTTGRTARFAAIARCPSLQQSAARRAVHLVVHRILNLLFSVPESNDSGRSLFAKTPPNLPGFGGGFLSGQSAPIYGIVRVCAYPKKFRALGAFDQLPSALR